MEEIITSKDGVTEEAGGGTVKDGDRTFTQQEVNAIVGERLKRERDKYADYDDLREKARKYDENSNSNKSELQKATEEIEKLQNQLDGYTKAESIRKIREKVSAETKVPASLLTGEDEEKCKEQAAAILAFAKPKEYPGAERNKVNHDAKRRDVDDSMREFAHQIFGKGE